MVARIVVFGKIYVVFPEEMVSDQPFGRMKDDGEILEREKFRSRGEEARSETANQSQLLGVQRARRIEIESSSVFAAGVVKTSAQMTLDAALMMRFGGVRRGRNFLRRNTEALNHQQQKYRVM